LAKGKIMTNPLRIAVGLLVVLAVRPALAQEVRILDTDPVLARITWASMTAGTLSYTVENASTTKIKGFGASLFVFSPDGAPKAGASWCGPVDLGPGQVLTTSKEVPFSAGPDDVVYLMVRSVAGGGKSWAIDAVDGPNAAKLEMMGRKSYLPLRAQAGTKCK